MSRTVRVEVPRSDSYPIVVQSGLLHNLPDLLHVLFAGRHLVLITDTHVGDLYGKGLIDRLSASEYESEVHYVTVAPGEKSKSIETVGRLYRALLDAGTRRRSLLLALGGGVITDLVGFVASTYMRGIPYINLPTTLIAQADASVGGKTAVNHDYGKNLIGSFWHPLAVYVDPSVLSTMPVLGIKNGLAEIIKVAIINSPELFNFVEKHWSSLLSYQQDHLEYVVTEAIREKVELLSADPYEKDLQRSLNFGHTLGHPLETLGNYSEFSHGEAVAVGMYIATQVALDRQICSTRTAMRIHRLIKLACLPSSYPEIDVNQLWHHLKVIRMIRDNQVHFVLPVDIGRVTFVENITLEEIRNGISSLQSGLDSI